MRFSAIKGLAETKRFLLGSLRKNHIAHAQLFLGPEGSANLAMAIAYVTYLNCENRDNDACGVCAACQKMEKFIHPDVHYVFPVSATKTITGKDVVSDSFLKDWRQFLSQHVYGSLSDWSYSFGGENKQLNISKEESRNIIRKLSLKAFEGNYKAVIIWMPEFLHPAAANGILKILEEPPEQTIFLLVAHDVDRLLPTILSRTQLVNISAFTDEEIARTLVEKNYLPEHISEEQIGQVAHMAEGNLTEALRLLNDAKAPSHRMFHEWMRLCYKNDIMHLAGESTFFQQHGLDNKKVSWMEYFGKMGKESQKSFLRYGLSMMRETLMVYVVSEVAGEPEQATMGLQRLYGDDLKFVTNFSKVMNFDKVERITHLLNEAYYHLERNASAKILFMDLSLKLSDIFTQN